MNKKDLAGWTSAPEKSNTMSVEKQPLTFIGRASLVTC